MKKFKYNIFNSSNKLLLKQKRRLDLVYTFRRNYGDEVDSLWVKHQSYQDGAPEKQQALVVIADLMISYGFLKNANEKDLENISYDEVHEALADFFCFISKCKKNIERRVQNHILYRRVILDKLRWDGFQIIPPFDYQSKLRIANIIRILALSILNIINQLLKSFRVITENYSRPISLGFTIYQVTPTAPPYSN